MSLFSRGVLVLGLGFLYAPVLVLVVYSFNASKLVTVWGGASLHWYAALLSDGPLIESALISMRIAVSSALIATALGTAAALVLDRHGQFAGRTTFSGLVYAPMVMPEVVTGLSLLLLFVALGLERGAATIIIAHATLATGFVAIVVGAQLRGFDRTLEEAAADLGAAPGRVFLSVTLPLIGPALAAGFLLAFTLSLDDLVVASFVSGPGATTLPMRLYSRIRLGLNPEINAASTLLLVVVTSIVLAATWLTRGPNSRPS